MYRQAQNVQEQINQQAFRQIRDETAIRFQELFTRFLKDFHDADSRVVNRSLERLVKRGSFRSNSFSFQAIWKKNRTNIQKYSSFQ